jgi:hypothetical protein
MSLLALLELKQMFCLDLEQPLSMAVARRSRHNRLASLES